MALKYKVGNKVRIKSFDWYNENKDENGDVDCGSQPFIDKMIKFCGKTLTIFQIDNEDDCYIVEEDDKFGWTDEMIEGLVTESMGEVSDGYHTFNELYEYRLLYNASFFNELAKQNLYDVHKSKKHSDGEDCFGGGWFIVMAELPTGQVSNHYEMKDWDLFQVPEKEKANKWDRHTPQDVAKRMREFLTPKPKYPKTYEECSLINSCEDRIPLRIIGEFIRLINARNAYWKIAGEEMGLGKPWKPDWDNLSTNHESIKINKGCFTYSSRVLVFPTEEMRDAFKENFKELIEICKELL